MAQQKWIKWIVGLSGVAVFTGFVGLISANGETKSTPTIDQSGSSIAQGDDPITDQWQSQTDEDRTGGFGRRGGGGFGGMGSDDGGTESQIPSGGQGSMRTHAS
ncbi:hypothetical protein [Cohnella sp. GbtcB17]|uniref:hypothetical protein n=1 Tax=Cohnella sp. GbtcB17 TaxID=2824762 RepID=UPI001C2F392B|nr:hypothetical protein [Cohnella sp. GbtcB17]